MPRIAVLALIWATGIILAALAITMAGRVGLLPTQTAASLAAGAVLALSWLATTLLVKKKKESGE